MSTLQTILDGLGYAPRRQQVALYEHLLGATSDGVVAQAGTGVGKSLAVLAAAADLSERGAPALVVCPTNILLDQYANKDAPAVEKALGVKIRTLKGRGHYLCASAEGWMNDDTTRWAPLLESGQITEVDDPAFGCPGSDDCDSELTCHYREAKACLEGADIIVTNAHLMVIDEQFKQMPHKDDCTDPDSCMCRPQIFPDLSAKFIDEAHTLEEVMRGFTSATIPSRTTAKMGDAGARLTAFLRSQRVQAKAQPTAELTQALMDLAAWKPMKGQKNQRMKDAAKSAYNMLMMGKRGMFADGSAVLWVDPHPNGTDAKLVATRISMAAMGRAVLTSTPFAMVSATIPSTLAQNLGVGSARFIDVGHPFDYGRQGRLGFSAYPGDYRSGQHPLNLAGRATELKEKILEVGGGALVLFSSYRDLNAVHGQIARDLRRAGLTVLIQDRDSDKRALGQAFKDDGHAVLFATKSFATGFDVPGEALRLVSIWKLPYPGNSPVVEAIRGRSWKAYEDMMLVDVTQAVGRLIRTETDSGTVWIADSRGRAKLLGGNDPLYAHLREFAPA